MKIELWQNYKDGELKYFWMVDDVQVSPPTGHETKIAAELWFLDSKYNMDPHFEQPSLNERWKEATRRSGEERRQRVTIKERRNAKGRRWTDQLH